MSHQLAMMMTKTTRVLQSAWKCLPEVEPTIRSQSSMWTSNLAWMSTVEKIILSISSNKKTRVITNHRARV